MKKITLYRIFVVSIILLVSLSPLTVLDVEAQEENSWTSLAPMPTPRRELGLVAVDGKIYAIGGKSGTSGYAYTDKNEEYNPATNTWAIKAFMPTVRSDFGIVVYQDKIYCFGGYDGIGLDITEVYDPVTDTWETLTPMPTAKGSVEASIVGDTIYVTTPERTHYAYDPQTDLWSNRASMLYNPGRFVSVVLDGIIHVIGSDWSHQIYDPESDSWVEGESLIKDCYFPVAAVTTGEYAPKRIYVFGADSYQFEFAYPVIFTGQSYDPKTDNWTEVAPIQYGHLNGGAVVIDDRIYLVGGGRPLFGNRMISEDFIDLYTPYLFGSIPDISVTSPEGIFYNQTSVSLEFTVNELTSWIGYSLDGKANVTITENTNLTKLSEGTHSLEVYAKDMAGDESSSTITFKVDTLPPVISVLSPENKTYGDSNILLNVEFEEEIADMSYSLDGFENVTFIEDITLQELEVGSHNVTVYAVDLAGHTGVSETIYFSIEPFPTTLAIALVAIIAVGLGIFGYFKKYKK